ncbi:hypothetical protein FJR38_24705 [Anabaena sp. UHCC 0253]|uniref:hypothetical protein n=1 Tax=Anabaena sp. UHCC 0253 TaxID=2590019 RepID=UPI0014467ACD|nr:hypothetical protein [Anabaena sp. UHCC 0253]MTJ55640.1 hypothetical protein [Anabaena sp. UHCC 0253]
MRCLKRGIWGWGYLILGVEILIAHNIGIILMMLDNLGIVKGLFVRIRWLSSDSLRGVAIVEIMSRI